MTEAETTNLPALRETAVSPAEQVAREAETPAPATDLSAPFVLRIGALLIDYMLVAGLLAALTVPGRVAHGVTRTGGGFIDTFGSWIALGVGIFNFVLLPLWRGQTLGKWATGLEIARLDGSRVRLGNALLRHFIGYPLTFLTAGLGFLLTIFNADNRALHDFIAGTIVMRARARPRIKKTAHRKTKKDSPRLKNNPPSETPQS